MSCLSHQHYLLCDYVDPADYDRTTSLLTFTPAVNNHQVSVTINDDSIREGNEIFFAQLDAQGQPVITNPDVATVTIKDNNDRKFMVCIDFFVQL